MSELRPGDIVIHKNGTIGKIAYSTFGLSVLYTIVDDKYGKVRGQTLGEPAEIVAKYWRKANDDEITKGGTLIE